ncbi:MAG TPA: class II aldolase/adducin family protein [Ktedonobacteraceae bacterium]|jgi:autoinducer 2 (AI-2) kinase
MSHKPALPATDDERKQLLADIVTELYRANLVTAMGGNVSVRCASRDDALWITPSQIFKGNLRPEQMIMVDFTGKRIDVASNPPGYPSVESAYHGGILRMRPEVNAVVHTHAPLATAFAMCDMQMPPITSEAILLVDLPTIPWAIGGSHELAEYVLEYVGKRQVSGAYLRNHGLVTVGSTLREAADVTYAVEHTIKIILACKTFGREPSLILPEGIKQVIEQAGEFAAR